VILDNGAAEDVTFGAKHLLTIADMIQADEIVVPDTLFDAEETISQALAFSRFAVPEHPVSKKPIKYMAVLQGTKWEEFTKCLRAYAEMTPLGYISSVGIPRLMAREDPEARIRMFNYIAEMDYHLQPGLEFHCLGSTDDLDEVRFLAEVPWARGIDTSVPISMGLQGIDIQDSVRVPRSDDFFELVSETEEVNKNIQTYLEWAKYEYNRPND
jgi:hypothetical protein